MKKVLSFAFLFLMLAIRLPADFTASLETLQEIQCEIEPMEWAEGQHRRPEFELPRKNSTSTNWSGYAVATSLARPAVGSVSVVSGSWTVPTVSAAPGQTFCSVWVGIDGYASPTVEQIGTEHSWINGRQVNYAWFEMYPRYPFTIKNFPVQIGDVIGAEVRFIGNGVFKLTIANYTKNIFATVPTAKTTLKGAKRSSAEWIVEAPSANNVLPLSNFGTLFLTNCLTTINGVNGSIGNPGWKRDAITMTTGAGIPKAIPSGLSNGGQNFNVIWKHR